MLLEWKLKVINAVYCGRKSVDRGVNFRRSQNWRWLVEVKEDRDDQGVECRRCKASRGTSIVDVLEQCVCVRLFPLLLGLESAPTKWDSAFFASQLSGAAGILLTCLRAA